MKRFLAVLIAVAAFVISVRFPYGAVGMGVLAGLLWNRSRSEAAPDPAASSKNSPAPLSSVVSTPMFDSGGPSPRQEVPHRSDAPAALVPHAGVPQTATRPPHLGIASTPLPPAAGTTAVGERPASHLPDRGVSVPDGRAHIVTRTSAARQGQPLEDPFLDRERVWAREEQARMLDLYEARQSVAAIAQAMRVDQRQVAIRLLRVLFDPVGDIDDATAAPRYGKNYSKSETEELLDVFHAGASILQIAGKVGRTQLGAAWKLFNLHVVQVPPGLRATLSGDA
ncbi:hypothetical protein AB4Y86_00060 [Arthrobacter sp. 2YAF22_2]|uniref:hypothetical protein n=1 Tax=Arthrobacter sp. 2YAF22_2 TaxID=3233029 RepID=UPI003F8DC988